MRRLDFRAGSLLVRVIQHSCLVTARSVHLRCSGASVPCIRIIGGHVLALIFRSLRPTDRVHLSNPCQANGAGLSCRGAWRVSSTLRVLVSRTMARRGVLLDTGPPAPILRHDVELFLAGTCSHRCVCPQPLLYFGTGSGQDFDPTWIEPSEQSAPCKTQSASARSERRQ